jgi:hypothetical protein
MRNKSGWKFKKLYRFAKLLCSATSESKSHFSPFGKSFYKLLMHSIFLDYKEGFTTKEVFRLGLFDAFDANGAMDKLLSKKKLLAMQNKINPLPLHELGFNKIIFYIYARQLNLPIPELYAIFFRKAAGWTHRKPWIVAQEKWAPFIKENLPEEFVIKPCYGSWGEDINIYAKTGSGLRDGFGAHHSEEDVCRNMLQNKKYDSFIMQERLRNNQKFFEVSPSKYLHCVRIITLIDASGKFSVLHGQLNLVGGQSIISQGGNLKVIVSPKDGCLEQGFLLNKTEGGFKITEKNPDTGVKFTGFRLPLWDEVLSLSEEAAFKFLPLRTVGWDIGITENDVKLIEANPYYGVPFTTRMSKFISDLRTGISAVN